MLALLAPAKINLGLEIVGRRPDGYHEIRTILVPVSVFDRVGVAQSESSSLWSSDPTLDLNSNLALHAAEALGASVRIELRKSIPVAAGLGGASSDAAAVLKGIGLLDPTITADRIHAAAGSLGADVPFFLEKGPVQASGRGDHFTSLPMPEIGWFLIAVPSIDIPRKTATLYASLAPSDFSAGSRVDELAAKLRTGASLKVDDLRNAFERPLYERWPAAEAVRDAMLDAGAGVVALSGAGPAHYAICDDFRAAAGLAAAVRRRVDRTTRLIVCRPISEPIPYRFVD